MRKPNIERRLDFEIPRLKKAFLHVGVSFDRRTAVVLVQTNIITLKLGENFPFEPPHVTVDGFLVSFIGKWSPQNRLVEFVEELIGDVRGAKLCDESLFQGKQFVLQKEGK